MTGVDAPEKPLVFVVDDHAAARRSMAETLTEAGYHVRAFASADAALRQVGSSRPDLILTDLQMPGMDGLELLRALGKRGADIQVVVVTAHGTIHTAVEAMRLGAFDFIEKPFEVAELEGVVRRALTQERLVRIPPKRPVSSGDGGEAGADEPLLLGESPAMQRLRRQIARLAAVDETVLILGESGTGKERVARAIHVQSRRFAGPLVGLNCPALSPQLMESELFGHERGAFTGAETRRIGRFELAHGGTLLLDEVTEIPVTLQAKLLRVLQEQVFERVGSSTSIEVDVRVVATSNRNMEKAVAEGTFREDLYFRLAVLPVLVPPLRARLDDVPLLARHFLSVAAGRLGRDPIEITPDALDCLMSYSWPGNVRQLENLMKRAAVLLEGDQLTADGLRTWLAEFPAASRPAEGVEAGMSLRDMERRLVEATLERFGGHREKTARALGIGVRTLCNKLRQYGYPPRANFCSKG